MRTSLQPIRRRLRLSCHLQCAHLSTTKSTAKPYTPIHTRYAPSPTGSLHLGGLRTALFNWLITRAHNHRHPTAEIQSTFVIRIEDTDQKRLVPESANSLLKTLSWFGIQSDGPVVHQSTRLSLYQQRAHQLVEHGHAYPCTCSAERLESLRSKGVAYDGFCSHLSVDDTAKRLRECIEQNISHTIRMRVPKTGATTVHDIIHGAVTFVNSAIEDQVLLKSDGFPTYHLAVVVDDHAQNITHVIRGDEWLPSAPKHILLYKYFNYPLPQYIHLPLLLRADGGKLSKRHADSAVSYYIEAGYVRDALINYVSMLGWNDGTSDELLSVDQLIHRFTLNRCQQSSAIVDIKKLNWMNQQYLRKIITTDVEQILQIIKPKIPANVRENYIIRALYAVKDNVVLIGDCLSQSKIFWENNYYLSKSTQQIRHKVWFHGEDERCLEILNLTKDALFKYYNNLNHHHKHKYTDNDEINLDEENLRLQEILKSVYDSFSLPQWKHGLVRQRQYYGLLRYALTGADVGMGISLIMSVMGYERVMRRLQFAIDTQAFKQIDVTTTESPQPTQASIAANA